eukprot:7606518-Lingulodinium_polyedra.AAC.1
MSPTSDLRPARRKGWHSALASAWRSRRSAGRNAGVRATARRVPVLRLPLRARRHRSPTRPRQRCLP